jgi:hypothetical protein
MAILIKPSQLIYILNPGTLQGCQVFRKTNIAGVDKKQVETVKTVFVFPSAFGLYPVKSA